jgi:hypothetical protein
MHPKGLHCYHCVLKFSISMLGAPIHARRKSLPPRDELPRDELPRDELPRSHVLKCGSTSYLPSRKPDDSPVRRLLLLGTTSSECASEWMKDSMYRLFSSNAQRPCRLVRSCVFYGIADYPLSSVAVDTACVVFQIQHSAGTRAAFRWQFGLPETRMATSCRLLFEQYLGALTNDQSRECDDHANWTTWEMSSAACLTPCSPVLLSQQPLPLTRSRIDGASGCLSLVSRPSTNNGSMMPTATSIGPWSTPEWPAEGKRYLPGSTMRYPFHFLRDVLPRILDLPSVDDGPLLLLTFCHALFCSGCCRCR